MIDLMLLSLIVFAFGDHWRENAAMQEAAVIELELLGILEDGPDGEPQLTACGRDVVAGVLKQFSYLVTAQRILPTLHEKGGG